MSTPAQEATNTTPEETQERVVSERAIRKGKKKVEKQFSHLERLKVEYLHVDKISPNDWNPNRQSDHDFELLLRSMEDDGFTQPVIVLEATVDGKHIVVDGEHRWRAAQSLGLTEIPVVKVDMTPEQARISTIRHNRARGSHDIELEAQILRDLQSLGALDVAMDALMLDDIEVNRLIEDIAVPDIMADEDYSEAWVPDSFSEEETRLVREGVDMTTAVEDTQNGATRMRAMTAAAVEQQRKREELIARAKTEEERNIARKESAVYRVSLIFSGEEAKVVKTVLGMHPAETLLALCMPEYEDMTAEEEE